MAQASVLEPAAQFAAKAARGPRRERQEASRPFFLPGPSSSTAQSPGSFGTGQQRSTQAGQATLV